MGLDGVLGLKLGAVTGPFERRLEELRRSDGVVGEPGGDRVEQGDERGDARSAGPLTPASSA